MGYSKAFQKPPEVVHVTAPQWRDGNRGGVALRVETTKATGQNYLLTVPFAQDDESSEVELRERSQGLAYKFVRFVGSDWKLYFRDGRCPARVKS